jgi:uncharacterized protein
MSVYDTLVRGAHRAYKLVLSPYVGRQCRFLPTCSDYMCEALILHGPLKGGWLGIKRICRCRPGGGKGIDMVPQKATKP